MFGLGCVLRGVEEEEKKGRTHDATHEEEDAEVVGLAQALDALVDVLGVETMVSQAKIAEQQSVVKGEGGKMARPEEDDAGRSADLIVG